jgi:hypothetical protein
MRKLAAIAALPAALLVAGCGRTDANTTPPLRIYDGRVQTSECPDNWFTGVDATARYSCSPGGYLIEFLRTGETGSVSSVKPTNRMRIDAIVQTRSKVATGAVSNPGVVCYVDTKHGWLARLGAGSAYDLIPLGSADTIAKGTSRAVRPLARTNRVVLTCDASGSRTLLSLSVNGTQVVRAADAGGAAPLVAFGVSGVGEIGSVVELRRIIATTGFGTLPSRTGRAPA